MPFGDELVLRPAVYRRRRDVVVAVVFNSVTITVDKLRAYAVRMGEQRQKLMWQFIARILIPLIAAGDV
jgi:hypothetical protein